jgi:hypothetical protein
MEFTEDNTFCISLLSRPDRWEGMQKRFDKFNMKVTRFIASTEEDLTGNFVYYPTT